MDANRSELKKGIDLSNAVIDIKAYALLNGARRLRIMVAGNAYADGELDREIVLSRVIDAPRDLVFRAWVEPKRMFQWFGPRGFRCEVRHVSEATAGAMWRFDMIAPNGHRYDSASNGIS